MEGIIAFGDVHGCYKAAERVVLLAAELDAQAIFLGDYVDRGPSAIETLRVLMQAKEQHPDWIFLRGNHDQMLLNLIEGRARTSDIGEVLGMNFDYAQTSTSFEEWQQTDAEEQEYVRSFLRSTRLYCETPYHIFCHAVLRDTRQSMGDKSSEELMWNYESCPPWEGKRFVHGHHPVYEPMVEHRGINVNTRCGYGGRLTGLHIASDGNPLCFYAIGENGDGPVRRLFSEGEFTRLP